MERDRNANEMRSRVFVVFVVFAIALVACRVQGPGSAGFSVRVVNGTDQTVTYFARGVGERPDSKAALGVLLQPGAADVDHWLYPDSGSGNRVATLYATSADGRLVYCRELRWDDIKRERFEFRISSDILRCAQPP